MAEDHGILTAAVVDLVGGGADQAILDNSAKGGRNQVLFSGASFLAGLAGHLFLPKGRKSAILRHGSDGLLTLGATLLGQSGVHYATHNWLNQSSSSSGSGSSTPSTGTSTSTSSTGTATTSSATTSSSTSTSASADVSTSGGESDPVYGAN